MTPDGSHRKLILASASKVRAQMLRNAGLIFDVVPADVDEEAIRAALDDGGETSAPSDIAVVLAQTKATIVSERHPDALVIGADQILSCEDEIYAKPANKNEARDQLLRLRGRSHRLISAAACAENGAVAWYHEESAHLTMRDFSNEFLGTYLATAGTAVTASVGAYQVEGLGIQLFSSIAGDYFTVLGLPLMPLLGYLRTQNMIQE